MTVVSADSSQDDSEPVRLEPRTHCYLSEWSSITVPGVRLSKSDRELVKRIGDSGKGRLSVDELRDGLRIRARSWVGVLRFEAVEVRIIPKLAGGQKSIARLLEFTSGLDGLGRFDADAFVKIEGTSLHDLVALLFAEATERVVRRGLVSDYIEREEGLPAVRGRILADRQILERFGRLDRVICRFDELEHDVDENRLLLLALRVSSRRVADRGLHRRLVRLRSLFEPICDPSKIDRRALNGSSDYNRLNAHYDRAHILARFLLDGLGVDDILTHGQTKSFAFLLDMN